MKTLLILLTIEILILLPIVCFVFRETKTKIQNIKTYKSYNKEELEENFKINL